MVLQRTIVLTIGKAYTMTTRTISALTLCTLLSTLETAAAANPKTGTLSGQVRDVKGKPIAGAIVKIIGTAEIIKTDSSGSYVFAGEDPGTYIISVGSAHCKQETLTVTLQPDTTQQL